MVADELPRTLTTDATGFIIVPRDDVEYGISLITRRGDESLAWVQISDRDSQGPTGTKSDPIVMRFRPLTHRVEGSVVDQQGKPIAGAEVVAQTLGQGVGNSSVNMAMFIFRPQQVPALPRAVTDQAGRFALVLPEGANASLGVQHPRYIGPGEMADPDDKALKPLMMEPAGTIAGRVVDAVTGQPVPRVLLGSAAHRIPSAESRRLGFIPGRRPGPVCHHGARAGGLQPSCSRRRLAVPRRRPGPWKECASAAARARLLS